MTVAFFLKEPKAPVSSVRVCITAHGKQYHKAAGISVKTADWKKQKSGNPKTDEQLKLIRIGLESVLDDFSTEQAIKDALLRVSKGKWLNPSQVESEPSERLSFEQYAKDWGDRPSGAKRQKQMTVRKMFEIMGKFDWDDVNEKFITKFIMKCDNLEMSRNYTGALLGRLKTILHEGQKLGYHDSSYWREIKRFKEPGAAVYLTKDEAGLMMNYKGRTIRERKAVDLFILGYKTGSRFSDYSRMTLDNIVNGRVVFVQQKTHDSVSVPASPLIREVLERNGGRAPVMNQPRFNKMLKTVAKAAGITSVVEVTRSVGAGHEIVRKEKWEFVSSHTCRRSCITNLYLSGLSAKECMVISGHKDLQSFELYLRMSKEDMLQRIAENDFFK